MSTFVILFVILVVCLSATELYVGVLRMNVVLASNAELKKEIAAIEARLTEKILAIEKLPLWWEREKQCE